MSGKGSSPRPIPDRERYESEFDRIFGERKDAPPLEDDRDAERA
jgi:hypothetical protein